MANEVQMKCPPSMAPHIQRVFNGEYDIAYQHPAPVILDIGANVGSFAIWAAHRWPGSKIHCYEPVPDNFKMLEHNVASLGDRVVINNYALGDPRHDKLFLGRNNCGEGSFFNLGSQTEQSIPIQTRPPTELPAAQIVKIDTEGAEIEILSMLPKIDFDVVLLEYHSEQNRRKVDELLSDYTLLGGEILGPNFGVLKYLHNRRVKRS